MFAVRATYHKMLQASPMQLVFGRDSILNIKHVADWEQIRQRKQLRINHNNKRENMRRNNHQDPTPEQRRDPQARGQDPGGDDIPPPSIPSYTRP